MLGVFKGFVSAIFEILSIMMELPLVFFIRFLSFHAQGVAEFFRVVQHLCGDNNILSIGLSACNSLLWGAAISFCIYRQSQTRGLYRGPTRFGDGK